jgi:hypothetical protein
MEAKNEVHQDNTKVMPKMASTDPDEAVVAEVDTTATKTFKIKMVRLSRQATTLTRQDQDTKIAKKGTIITEDAVQKEAQEEEVAVVVVVEFKTGNKQDQSVPKTTKKTS